MNGMFDWLVEVTCGKVVWKYSYLVPGQLCMITIIYKILEWSVNSLVTTLMVSIFLVSGCVHVETMYFICQPHDIVVEKPLLTIV